MVQSSLRNSQKRKSQVAQDNRLLGAERSITRRAVQDGRHSRSEGVNETKRLDDLDRHRKCLSSCPSQFKFERLPWIQIQRQIVQKRRNALWHQACTTHNPKDNDESNVILQGNNAVEMYSLQRRLHFLQLRQGTVQPMNTSNKGETQFIGMDHSRREVLSDSKLTSRVSWVENKFFRRQNLIDNRETIRNDVSNVEMEKDSINAIINKDQILNELNWKDQFPRTLIQKGGLSHESDESNEEQGSAAIHSNQPARATLLPVEAILRTDASEDGWGTELEILKTGMKIKESGKWKRLNWRLSSSNQRETAAILQGIQKLEKYSDIGKISSMRIETDNSVAAFNLQRGAAAVPLAKLTDRILQEAEALKIQISAGHVPGKKNTVAVSISRLETSGDYMINPEILAEALDQLQVRPSIDVFANRRNR
ncbi:MAG: hypothetical protein EZS28_043595 [Streblomastix strix]|uniref:Uncharacterized protein n=1 Tax=Streblomastix strix TaxID=222440 RepID=A0A5J4TRK8_9EUKA|nr:MAG: hypothetical protein EZS28_043595 [Streblomastix strix]